MKLFLANLRILVRNRQSLFWVLFFPLIFIVIFGLFFGGSTTKIGSIALVDQATNDPSGQIVKQVKTVAGLTVNTDFTTADSATTALKKSSVIGVLVIPPHFGEPGGATELTLITSAANSTTNGALQSLATGLLGQLNQEAIAHSLPPAVAASMIKPVFTLHEESTSSEAMTYFDFVLIGIIGMALMNSSIMGVSVAMSKYREDQILKRITTTPLPTWKFIVAEVSARLVLNIAQIAIILLVAIKGFHGHLYGNIGLVFLLAMLGAVMFQLIGFVIASLTSTTRAAEGMSQAVSMPMMFLAGVFFPADSLPLWLQHIVAYLPLAPLLAMMRQVGLDRLSPLTDPKNMYIVLGWIVILLFISVRRFRLSEE